MIHYSWTIIILFLVKGLAIRPGQHAGGGQACGAGPWDPWRAPGSLGPGATRVRPAPLVSPQTPLGHGSAPPPPACCPVPWPDPWPDNTHMYYLVCLLLSLLVFQFINCLIILIIIILMKLLQFLLVGYFVVCWAPLRELIENGVCSIFGDSYVSGQFLKINCFGGARDEALDFKDL